MMSIVWIFISFCPLLQIALSNNGQTWPSHATPCNAAIVQFHNEEFRKSYTFYYAKITWEDGRDLCLADNAHLLRIISEEENEFLAKTTTQLVTECEASSERNGHEKGIWLNCHKPVDFRRYQCVSDHATDHADETFSNWAILPPVHSNSPAHHYEGRAYLKLADAKWHEEINAPEARKYVVCQRRYGNAPFPSSATPDEPYAATKEDKPPTTTKVVKSNVYHFGVAVGATASIIVLIFVVVGLIVYCYVQRLTRRSQGEDDAESVNLQDGQEV